MYISFKIDEAANGKKLDVFLRSMGFSASLIRSIKYISGAICVNGAQAKTNYLLKKDDLLELSWVEKATEDIAAQDIELDIVYESEHSIIVNKPAGLAVHPTLNYKHSTLANGFAMLCKNRGVQMPFRPIGRLDKNTSGLMLLAKNAYAAAYMQHRYEKSYFAIIEGIISSASGVIDAPIAVEEASVIKRCVNFEQGKNSVTEYELLAAGHEACLMRVLPKTGRTHQIRVHFAHIGHPLLGDDLYGGSLQHISRHALHCSQIVFEEPQNLTATTCCCGIPPDMKNACNSVEIKGFYADSHVC